MTRYRKCSSRPRDVGVSGAHNFIDVVYTCRVVGLEVVESKNSSGERRSEWHRGGMEV